MLAATPLAIEPGTMALLKNVALIICFLVFVGVVLRMLLAGRGRYERASRLPLEDGPGERHGDADDRASRN
jgi:cbb3-type cytochrome oxidase subunit 3